MSSIDDIRKYQKGQQLFATMYCDDGINEAKDYIARNGYTKDDVALIKADDVIYVKALREIVIG